MISDKVLLIAHLNYHYVISLSEVKDRNIL